MHQGKTRNWFEVLDWSISIYYGLDCMLPRPHQLLMQHSVQKLSCGSTKQPKHWNLQSPPKKKKNSVFFPPKQSLAMTKVHYIKWEELQHFFRKYNHIIKRWLCINRKTQVAGKTVRFFSVKRKLFYVYISYTYYILNVWSLGIGSLLKFLRG